MSSWLPAGIVLASALIVVVVYLISVSADLTPARRATRRRRKHGPWCIVRNRTPYGLQTVFQSRSKGVAVQWRARHREEYDDTLFLLLAGDVSQVNGAAMSQDAFWDLIDRFPVLYPPPGETMILPLERNIS